MARPRIIGLLLALITLVVYLPSSQHDFIVFDDPDYVTENRVVQSGITVRGCTWAFTTFHASNWHPVTWLSHMLDCELFGLGAGAHHIISALFHSTNAVLLFVLLLRLTGRIWPAATVAAGFAWHPLRIESVAWISERKDVLSMLFGLLCLLAYVRHAHASKVQGPKSGVRPLAAGFYWLAILFFALGLMAKPMLVTLPFVMLLLDWWPLKRIAGAGSQAANVKRLVLEKGPFFLLATASCVVTILAQRSEAVVALEQHPLDLRLKNAAVSCAGYILKTGWPTNLAIIYPLPKVVSLVQAAIATAAIILISFLAFRMRKTRPHLLAGWLWFLGTLVPVIGIVQVGGQAMADRYTYLPQIGLLIAVVFELSLLATRFQLSTKATVAISVVPLLACLVVTTCQLRYWKDSEALFGHAISVTSENPVARINLGVALEAKGRRAEAKKEYEEALRIDPERIQAHINFANFLDQAGEQEAALEHYRFAMQRKPTDLLVHINLGSTLVNLGRFDEAMQHYKEAERLKPDDPRPRYLMGKSLLRQGRSKEATEQFKRALQVDAGNLQALVWLARTLAADQDSQVRNGVEAVALAKRANSGTSESDPFVLDTLAMAYAEAGRFDEAQQTIDKAIQIISGSKGDSSAPQTRQQLYQSRQPYRESFTNAPAGNPAQR